MTISVCSCTESLPSMHQKRNLHTSVLLTGHTTLRCLKEEFLAFIHSRDMSSKAYSWYLGLSLIVSHLLWMIRGTVHVIQKESSMNQHLNRSMNRAQGQTWTFTLLYGSFKSNLKCLSYKFLYMVDGFDVVYIFFLCCAKSFPDMYIPCIPLNKPCLKGHFGLCNPMSINFRKI